jgi:hypothetical protein
VLPDDDHRSKHVGAFKCFNMCFRIIQYILVHLLVLIISCHRNFTMYGPQTPGRGEDYNCPCHENIQGSRSIATPIPNLSTRNLAPNEQETGQSVQPVCEHFGEEKNLLLLQRTTSVTIQPIP